MEGIAGTAAVAVIAVAIPVAAATLGHARPRLAQGRRGRAGRRLCRQRHDGHGDTDLHGHEPGGPPIKAGVKG